MATAPPQNSPVGLHDNAELDTIDNYGRDLANTRKFRYAQANPNVAIVVDDLASVQPWQVRGVEIRGVTKIVRLDPTSDTPFSPELIRIHPQRVISWGLDS